MKWILLAILIIFSGCKYNKENLKDLTLEYGSKLADHQDNLIQRYKKGEEFKPGVLDSLKNNIWFKAAEPTTPGNLVIRQWILIDLISKKDTYREKIGWEMSLMSTPYKGTRLWSESYSYWLYTRHFIEEWLKLFEKENDSIQLIMNQIDTGFVMSAYLRGDTWYPAPVGDLRDRPLANNLQHLCRNRPKGRAGLVGWIIKNDTTFYKVYGRPLGFNLHVPIDTLEVKVFDGSPLNFKFYEGYDKKYPNPEKEIEDMMDKRRLESAALIGLEFGEKCR